MVVVAVMASGWRRRTFNNGRIPLSLLPFTLPSCSTDAASRIVVKHPRLLIASNPCEKLETASSFSCFFAICVERGYVNLILFWINYRLLD